MKKIFSLLASLLLTTLLSAQTMVFHVRNVKAKEHSENEMEKAYETCCSDMKPNKGGFALRVLGAGADNGMTHQFLWYWELGEDLWEGTNIDEKAALWWSQMDNYVEEYGDQYLGRVLSRQEGTNKDYKWTHIWDFKVDDANQFKTGHDKIIKKFEKEFEGRSVGFGTYDINRPDGATHWVGISGEGNHDHVMLMDKLQSQSEFIKMLAERGKSENVKDYMVKDLKTY